MRRGGSRGQPSRPDSARHGCGTCGAGGAARVPFGRPPPPPKMAPRPPQRGNRSWARHGRAGTGQTRAGGPACCQSGVPLHGGLTWLPAPGRPRPGGPARSLGRPRRGSGSCRPRRHGAPVGPEGEPAPQGCVSPGLCFSLPPTCVSVYSTGCVLFPKRTHGFLLKNKTRGKQWFIISLHGSICQI